MRRARELTREVLSHLPQMFIGHFDAGFGAESIAPKVSLGSLFLATGFYAVV